MTEERGEDGSNWIDNLGNYGGLVGGAAEFGAPWANLVQLMTWGVDGKLGSS